MSPTRSIFLAFCRVDNVNEASPAALKQGNNNSRGYEGVFNA
jgi:hypothetical protein